nr:12162_t:CDS:2 [Entrophospora candida]
MDMHIIYNRTKSFTTAKKKKWPHGITEYKATPETLAHAGFYFDRSNHPLDNVICFICGCSIKGWNKDDDPFQKHQASSPDCPWVLCRNYSNNKNNNTANESTLNWDDKNQWPTSKKLEDARIKTFGNWWPHKEKKTWTATVKKLAKAGFYYYPLYKGDDNVVCPYCNISLEGWEPDDDPVKEHTKRSITCLFFAKPPKSKKSKAPAAITRKPKKKNIVEFNELDKDVSIKVKEMTVVVEPHELNKNVYVEVNRLADVIEPNELNKDVCVEEEINQLTDAIEPNELNKDVCVEEEINQLTDAIEPNELNKDICVEEEINQLTDAIGPNELNKDICVEKVDELIDAVEPHELNKNVCVEVNRLTDTIESNGSNKAVCVEEEINQLTDAIEPNELNKNVGVCVDVKETAVAVESNELNKDICVEKVNELIDAIEFHELNNDICVEKVNELIDAVETHELNKNVCVEVNQSIDVVESNELNEDCVEVNEMTDAIGSNELNKDVCVEVNELIDAVETHELSKDVGVEVITQQIADKLKLNEFGDASLNQDEQMDIIISKDNIIIDYLRDLGEQQEKKLEIEIEKIIEKLLNAKKKVKEEIMQIQVI